MRRTLPLAVVLGVLAIAAPAQAAITGSTITTPSDPHFVLIDSDAAAPTLSVAGTATGTGSVDVVCVRNGVGFGDVFAAGVPVAADGTFAVSDVPLTAQAGVRSPWSSDGTCRLEAWPDGATPADRGAFSGPRIALSKLARQRLSVGANAGAVYDAFVLASGVGYSTLTRPFGHVGINDASALDPDTFRASLAGIYNSGSLAPDPPAAQFSLAVDGQPAYPPAVASTGVGSAPSYENPGLVAVTIGVTQFSPATGDMTVREVDQLVKCAPDNAYPPTAASCRRFAPVPVVLVRTTEYSHGQQVTRVVDRWRSTDGLPHRLDLSILQSRCLGAGGYVCSAHVAHRLPGDAAYAERPDGTTTGPIAAGAILSRDARDAALGGTAVILGQRTDSVRFRRDTYNDAFVLDYRARTIPASGELTMSHTYALTRSADGIEALAAALVPAPPPSPSPSHATPTPKRSAAPVLSQRGRVRVRRAGRTFLVRTRDRVQCPAGGPTCVVGVHGTRVRASASTLAAGATARVAFRLDRRGVRALTRKRRLRVTVGIDARAGSGTPVTRVRRVTLRLR
jgi:hypothetical protein